MKNEHVTELLLAAKTHQQEQSALDRELSLVQRARGDTGAVFAKMSDADRRYRLAVQANPVYRVTKSIRRLYARLAAMSCDTLAANICGRSDRVASLDKRYRCVWRRVVEKYRGNPLVARAVYGAWSKIDGAIYTDGRVVVAAPRRLRCRQKKPAAKK